MDLYREIILEHYKHPLHKGKVGRADYSSDVSNPSCGDILHVEFEYDSNGIIMDAKFSGTGCAISQAAADLVLEKAKGAMQNDVQHFTKEDVFELLGGPVNPGREKCAMLIVQALSVFNDKKIEPRIHQGR